MRTPCGPLVGILILILTTATTSPVAAAPSSVVLTDAAGDAGDLPCSDATDLLRFTAAWGTTGVELSYAFTDLSVLETPAATLQDLEGRCFWSYTDFVAEVAGVSFEDSVYIDHSTHPLFETGWRFYLHEAGIELPAVVDGNDIHVTIPYSVIGTPSAGDRIGDFRIQVTNAADPLALTYATDWAPDSSQPCGCWAVY